MTLAMLMSGTIGLFVVESGQDNTTVVFWHCLIGGSALLAYLSWRRQWQALSRTNSGWLLLGGLALVANWFCLFGAYHLSSISIATLVYHTQPFFLLLIVAISQRQAIAASQWWLLLLALLIPKFQLLRQGIRLHRWLSGLLLFVSLVICCGHKKAPKLD